MARIRDLWKAPLSVQVGIGVNAMLLVGALIGIVYFVIRQRPLDAGADAIAAATEATALYAMASRKWWARLVFGLYFGAVGILGSALVLVIVIPTSHPLKAWPGFVFFPLLAWIGLAFLLGKAERSYFVRTGPGIA